MKIKDRYRLINCAIREYSENFKLDYKPIYKSKSDIKLLLKQYPHSLMCEWSYCCYGLNQCCWQEPVFEGNWGMAQERVNEYILNTFSSKLLKKCRTENRMYGCERDDRIHIVIIARDLEKHKRDYLFTFSKSNH